MKASNKIKPLFLFIYFFDTSSYFVRENNKLSYVTALL